MSESLRFSTEHEPQAACSQAAFVLEADEARFLTEVGMLAAANGDTARADRIFLFLRKQRPNRAFPLLGLAVALLNAGRAQEAAKLLQETVLSDPQENDIVRAWCGLALQLEGRTAHSRLVLLEAAQGAGEGAELARQLLGLTASSEA